MRKFRVFVAAISDLVCLCWATGRFSTLRGGRVNIPHFRCGYFQLVCVFVWTGSGTIFDMMRVKIMRLLLQLFPDCTIVFPVFENFRKLASEMYKNSGMPYKVMAHYHKLGHGNNLSKQEHSHPR